jgi:hypothetical protein
MRAAVSVARASRPHAKRPDDRQMKGDMAHLFFIPWTFPKNSGQKSMEPLETLGISDRTTR